MSGDDLAERIVATVLTCVRAADGVVDMEQRVRALLRERGWTVVTDDPATWSPLDEIVLWERGDEFGIDARRAMLDRWPNGTRWMPWPASPGGGETR